MTTGVQYSKPIVTVYKPSDGRVIQSSLSEFVNCIKMGPGVQPHSFEDFGGVDPTNGRWTMSGNHRH